MKRVKKRIFSGCVCEQLVYNVRDCTDVKTAREPRPRFKDAEERAHHREKISMRANARKFNANFGPWSLYSTLTFSNEEEVHTFEEARKIRDNFVRCLKRKHPDAVIFIYMGRGKHTNRIHFHMVSNGIPADVIAKKWKYGTIVRIEPLREHNYYNGTDRGRDYTGLANYLWSHWTPEQGGHHCSMTKNARKADEETPREVKQEYTEKKPPRPPKGYILVETKATKYGLLYFKYIRQPEEQTKKRKQVDDLHRLS